MPPTASAPMTAAAATRVDVFIVEPPRHASDAPLWVWSISMRARIDHPVGDLVRALDEERAKETVELALVGHRGRPPATATGRSSASMAARIARWA